MSKQSHLCGLDILKFMASIVILLHHYYLNTGLACLAMFANGGIAVELFFTISGFLTVYSCLNDNSEESFRGFMIRKVAHYFPMSFIIIVLYVLGAGCYYYMNGTWYRPGASIAIDYWNVFTSVFLIFSGGAVGNVPLGVNNPIWYICVLLICESLFWIINNRISIKPFYGYVIMVLIGLSVRTYGIYLPFLNGQVARGYYCFYLGCILCVIIGVASIKSIRIISFVLILLYSMPKIMGIDVLYNNWQYSISFILFPAIIMLSASYRSNSICGVTKYLSKLSFGIYLIHGLLLLLQGLLYSLNIVDYDINALVVFCVITTISAVLFVKGEKILGKKFYKAIDEFSRKLVGE